VIFLDIGEIREKGVHESSVCATAYIDFLISTFLSNSHSKLPTIWTIFLNSQLHLTIPFSFSSSVYRVYSSLSVILQRDSQDKSPAGQYLQLKTRGNLIYTVRIWAGGKLPSVSLNSSTELAVVAADGRLFQSRMDLGKKEFR
jgi:hypothetical protein